MTTWKCIKCGKLTEIEDDMDTPLDVGDVEYCEDCREEALNPVKFLPTTPIGYDVYFVPSPDKFQPGDFVELVGRPVGLVNKGLLKFGIIRYRMADRLYVVRCALYDNEGNLIELAASKQKEEDLKLLLKREDAF